MVFGVPTLLLALSVPYPQEVFVALTVFSSVCVFWNGMYMVIYGEVTIRKIKNSAHANFTPERQKADPESQVIHWVMIPNYQEELEVLIMTLESVSKSSMARTQ